MLRSSPVALVLTLCYNRSMVKKKATQRQVVTTQPVRTFDRWLISGLATVFIFVLNSLIVALYMKTASGVSSEGGFVISALTFLMYAAGAWWLFESARWIVITIDRKSAPVKRTTKKK